MRVGADRSLSTPVIAGLCDWTSWQNDAEVKKIDPTKKVTASTCVPTASTYAGIVPRAKHEEPIRNNQAIAELSRTGAARTLVVEAGCRLWQWSGLLLQLR